MLKENGECQVIRSRVYEWSKGGECLLTEAVVHPAPAVSLTHKHHHLLLCAPLVQWKNVLALCNVCVGGSAQSRQRSGTEAEKSRSSD